MIVIPAIDLKDGLCVRLLQGDKHKVTVYSENPAETALHWESMGARLLHIVDLDGAFTGDQKNFDAVMAVRNAVKIPLEVGGGIRKIDTVDRLVSVGIERIIIGTSAIEDPEFLADCCKKFPGKILVGIDARNGMVAIRGWEELTTCSAHDLAQRLEGIGISGIIYTDIHRDGMLSGPNLEATAAMVRSVSIPVIASGGISSIEDIQNLLRIDNLWGAITGKAIYSQTLDLREALRLTGESHVR